MEDVGFGFRFGFIHMVKIANHPNLLSRKEYLYAILHSVDKCMHHRTTQLKNTTIAQIKLRIETSSNEM